MQGDDGMIEKAFASHDGVELFYRVWPARSGTARGAIVLLHRGHEHGGRVAHIAEELGLDDYRLGAALIAEWPEMAGGFAHEAGCLSILLESAGEGRRPLRARGPIG